MSSRSGVSLNAFSNPGGLPQTCSILPVIAVTVATTLTTAQSGSIVRAVSAGADYTITLPPIQPGLNFKIVQSATAGTNTIRVTSSLANVYVSAISSCNATSLNTGSNGV